MVRADLPLAKQLVHVAHAAGESVTVAPLSPATRVALFHAADETELLAYADKVRAAGFPIALIHEPEGPEYGRGNVSFGICPSAGRRNKLRKLFHHLAIASFAQVAQ